MKIGVILGSTRPGRVGLRVSKWFLNQVQAKQTELEFELIDLDEVNLPFLDEPKSASTREYTKDHTKAWSEKIKEYDGYVLITAEYNHGYPAPLKNALDFLAHEWNRKPVAFVGYGGLGGTRAVEQLRQVCSELGMAPIWTAVHVRSPARSLDEDGDLLDEGAVHANIDGFVSELEWWVKALKAAQQS